MGSPVREGESERASGRREGGRKVERENVCEREREREKVASPDANAGEPRELSVWARVVAIV
jgi:hypothetical protein